MEEKISYLALSYNFKPPHKKVLTLYKKYKSFSKVFQLLEKEFKIKLDWEKEYLKLKNLGGEIILINEKVFPQELKFRQAFILGIFILGEKNLNKFKEKIAIVGTRKPTKIGEKTAKNFSYILTQNGLCLVSGLAYGIDLAAHLGSIEAGKENIAVIGCGFDFILKDPRKKYLEKIIEVGGSIISEYPLKTPPLNYHFPLRNRIIAGLSKLVIIIEAPEKSGALITANFALEYGKDVYALPGSIYEKNYLGNLKLIQEGAFLLISPEEILEVFGIRKNKKFVELKKEEEKIYQMIKEKPKSIEELIKESGLEVSQILKIITSLEIKNLIFVKEGKYYSNENYNY